MARIQASVKLDPNRYPEQLAYLAERVQVLRQAGEYLWVALEDSQVDALVGQGLVVVPMTEADLVELPALSFRPASEPPEPPSTLQATEPSGENTGDYLLQFSAPADKSWLNELAGIGAEQLQVLPLHAGVFRMTRAQADAVRALPYVAYAGPFHPAYAVSPELAGASEAPFTASSLRNMQVTLPADDPAGNLDLRFFDAIDPEERRADVSATGATIVTDIAHGFRVRVAQNQLQNLLRISGLYSAAPPSIPTISNNNGGVILGTNQVRAAGSVNFLVNLDGRGEIAGMVDSGCDLGNLALAGFHGDLQANVRLVRNSAAPQNAALAAPDTAPHGTHVAGTICGDGTNSGGQVKGMAPAAALIAQGPLPGNFRVPFEFAFQNGARVINNSWGVPATGNPYQAGTAQALDHWCFTHPDVLLLFAAGNEEEDAVPAPGGNGVLDARKLRKEATAKNVLTVGASESLRNNGGWPHSYRAYFSRFNHAGFNATGGTPANAYGMSDNPNDVALFSSRGSVRTSAGVNTMRVKPDVVAPGTNILSVRSQALGPAPAPPAWPANWDLWVPAGVNVNLYHVLHGTSMATPMVTGCSVLLRQYYRERFAQLRRPQLLEGALIPATPPLPVFTGVPAVAPHADGLVFAWCSPDLPAATKKIQAIRLSRTLAPVDATPIKLQDDVGDHPAPKLVTRGERTYLLHRHGGNTMRLSCYNRALQLETTFGTNGVVTLSPNTRPDDNVAPDLLLINDILVCTFPTTASGNGYFFQRFRADTGAAVDSSSISFLFNDNTGPHASLVFTGTRYTVCGVAHPGNYQLQVHQMDDSAHVQGTGPVTLVDQAQEIREPCLIWNSRLSRHVLVWCDARAAAGGELYRLFLDGNGAAIGAPQVVMSAPPGSHMRRPRILTHPQVGHILLWEDDTQNAQYDVYAALLDDNAQVDGRLLPNASDGTRRALVRISDTPQATAGFVAIADAAGVCLAFQSPDEINSDRMGIYALNLTPAAKFAAQEDAQTPLYKSGSYGTVEMLSHNSQSLTALCAEWAGGAYYLLRVAPNAITDQLQWVRLNADGLQDISYAAGGVRTSPVGIFINHSQLLWTGQALITAVSDFIAGITIHMHDAQGTPVANFGAGGAAALQDPVPLSDAIAPQVGFRSTGSQVLVAYGTNQGGSVHLRYQRLDNHGARVGAPLDLALAAGVAQHSWFQYVPSEGQSIAIYHRVDGGATRVHCRRFNPDGSASGAERDLSAAAGEATSGVIARRPTAVSSPNREYAAVWQYRANNGARWELHYSRLDRQGRPLANPPAPAPPMPVADFAVIAAGPDWPADRDAIEPQLVCTYTHAPWQNPPSPLPAGTSLPEWSPSHGLAWIGVLPGGARVLYFTMLDENGRRCPIPQPPPAAGALLPPAAAPIVQISAADSNVRNFKLVWNGRIFFLYWVELVSGNLRHRCTAINRHANQLAYDVPSAALLRATLVNGATNINSMSLPDTTNGYGWGRVNMRQTLAPAPPVTLQVRDDCAIGPGRTVGYRFTLPAGTELLRVTLNWTDPPGARLVNPLHLTVRAPAAGANPRPEYRGNLWDPTANNNHLSRPVASPPVAADNHENVQLFKQVVLRNPPPGIYEVEVAAAPFPADPFNQQNLQAFALVFAGSGPEVVFSQPVAAVQTTGVY